MFLPQPNSGSGASRMRRTQRGVVSIEMLMALFPLFIAFLGITQLALLRIGAIVVQHAATRAARAAVVILDDNPKKYGDAPRGDLVAGVEEPRGAAALLRQLDSSFDEYTKGESLRAGARMKAIQAAAHHPLAVLGPDPTGAGRLDDDLDGSMARILAGRFIYAPVASSITLHHDGNDSPLLSVGPKDEVVVRIAFLMPCSVPLASAIMCTSVEDLVNAHLGAPTTERAQEITEALKHASSPILQLASIASGTRFTLLKAEARFVAQGATYHPGES